MRSETSYFNKTVFLHDLKRFWPLTAGYTLIWLLVLPLDQFTTLRNRYWYAYSGDLAQRVLNVQRNALGTAVTGGYLMALCFGILFAMAVFSYLTSPRATNGLHALSARRETLYVTHYLSGLCCQLAPQVLTILLTAAVLGANGFGSARVTGMMFAMCLSTVFFYSFGVLCMIFTGQILAAPVFYVILNVLAVSVEYLLTSFAGNFLYGWADSFDARLKYFSPAALPFFGDMPEADYLYETIRLADGSTRYQSYAVTVEYAWLLWVYAAVGLVFAALGLLLYKKRRSEATGTTVAIEWARPVFKYGVTFCAALALGQLLYYMFFGQYRSNGDYSLPGTIACMAAAGLIGYFAAEMLLKKSFRVLRSGWRGAVVVMAVLVALGCVMSLDLTGYERWVPDESEIVSASVDFSIYGNDAYAFVSTMEPEQLRLITAAHRALIGDKARQQSLGTEFYDQDGVAYGRFGVSYSLRDGRVVRRDYSGVAFYEAELGDPNSPAAAATALYNNETVALLRTLGRLHVGVDSDPRRLNGLRLIGGRFNAEKYHELGDYFYSEQFDLSAAEAQELYDAILRDVAARRIDDTLFGSDDEYAFAYLELYATYIPRDTDAPVPADVPPSTQQAPAADGRRSTTFNVRLSDKMTDTLAVLNALENLR